MSEVVDRSYLILDEEVIRSMIQFLVDVAVLIVAVKTVAAPAVPELYGWEQGRLRPGL